MYDCTFIVTAKSKEQLELLQPHEIIHLRGDEPQETMEADAARGYCLSMRLKPQPCDNSWAAAEENLMKGDQ